jgi:hypothetical protein
MLHGIIQNLVRRSDQPHVGDQLARAAERPETLVLKNLSSVTCAFGLKVSTSSRNRVPPSAWATSPRRAVLASVNAPTLMAEELGLDEVIGQRSATDRHEGPGRALAAVVNRPRRQLLARAGLAFDQHRRAARGNA